MANGTTSDGRSFAIWDHDIDGLWRYPELRSADPHQYHEWLAARTARGPVPVPGERNSHARFGTTPTARELQALAYALRKDSKRAAAEMGISEQTVKNHLTALYLRLGAQSKNEAAIALGWLVVPDVQLEEIAS